MIHQLRKYQRGIARGLSGLLLLSWLSVFCGPCLAMASGVTAIHAGMDSADPHAMAHGSTAGGSHDCCDKSAAATLDTPCDGLSCNVVASVVPVTPDSLLLAASSEILLQTMESPSAPPPPALRYRLPLYTGPPVDSVPAYLRFGVFLN